LLVEVMTVMKVWWLRLMQMARDMVVVVVVVCC
jgi:hypothetical protein